MAHSTDVNSAVEAAAWAMHAWQKLSRGERAAALEAVAAALEARKDDIIRTACEETALTAEEFAPEFGRMTGTFRMFAGLVREGSWVRAAVDRPRAEARDAIGPNHDVRRMLFPLGVVAVFGASNFPLSYGVCGGDTASALAAGCCVVVKEHPAHPRLGRLIHAVAAAVLANGLLGYVRNNDPKDLDVAKKLVEHKDITAVGFTGSVGGGMAIDAVARARPRPIPVFAEMGSNNIVVVTKAAMEERGEAIAEELAQSVLTRFGQQCTCMGVLLIEHPPAFLSTYYDTEKAEQTEPPLVVRLRELIGRAADRAMLTEHVAQTYRQRLEDVRGVNPFGVKPLLLKPDAGADRRVASPAIFNTDSGELWEHGPDLRDEVFGPAFIIARNGRSNDIAGVLEGMRPAEDRWGMLAASIYLGKTITADDRVLIDALARYAGRVVFNGVPTGVRVAHGMVHSGPFPACNRPDTTAVGPLAIERWCRPVCFQNAPQELLPDELKDGNPLGIGRHEDGVWVPAGRC